MTLQEETSHYYQNATLLNATKTGGWGPEKGPVANSSIVH